MQPITYLIASTLLSPIVLAAPRPQAAPQNPTWQDFDVSTQVSGPNGSFTIESRLTDFRGCSGDRTKVVKKAFADALKIVGSVGKPGLILGHEPGDETPKDQVVYDYWGPKENWDHTILTGNYERAQLTGDQWAVGDWWYGRYFQITCDDPLKRCRDGLRAYENDPGTKENDGKYPRINLCDVGANNFWSLKTLDEKINDVKAGVAPKENIESLRSKGSVLLHEMFHTTTKYYAGGYEAGISQPKAIDVIPSNTNIEKAYGAARSKWLARRRTYEMRSLVYKNVDNYVYYALTRYMMQTLEVPYPPEPAAGWTAAVAIAGEVGEEPVDDWDTNNQVVVELSSDSESLSDEELTAEPKPTGPSTILPPPARRTNIGV